VQGRERPLLETAMQAMPGTAAGESGWYRPPPPRELAGYFIKNVANDDWEQRLGPVPLSKWKEAIEQVRGACAALFSLRMHAGMTRPNAKQYWCRPQALPRRRPALQ
jgi:hypothetical protein